MEMKKKISSLVAISTHRFWCQLLSRKRVLTCHLHLGFQVKLKVLGLAQRAIQDQNGLLSSVSACGSSPASPPTSSSSLFLKQQTSRHARTTSLPRSLYHSAPVLASGHPWWPCTASLTINLSSPVFHGTCVRWLWHPGSGLEHPCSAVSAPQPINAVFPIICPLPVRIMLYFTLCLTYKVRDTQTYSFYAVLVRVWRDWPIPVQLEGVLHGAIVLDSILV